MKLLLVAPIFAPSIGGVPTLYQHICSNLPPEQVVVLAPDCPGAKEFDAIQPYTIYRIPKFAEIDMGGLFSILREAWTVLRLASREGATHIGIGHVNQSLLAMLLRPWTRREVFLYAHGEEIAQDYGGRLYSLCKARFLKTLRKAVSVSRYTRGQLLQRGGPKMEVAVIANAVDSTAFCPMDKDPALLERWGLAGKKVMLTVSRLEERKGHDKVIEALPEILAQVPNAHYLVCGNGEEAPRLKAMVAERGLDSTVTFVPYVAAEELCRVYNLAEVFVMPNRTLDSGVTEGFGIVFLEAGACAVPVVGGNAGGVPDAIRDGETGFLVDGNDVAAIADRVGILLDDDETARRMGQSGLAFARRHDYGTLVGALTGFLG